MCIADGEIVLFAQWVVRQVVGFEVLVDVAFGPIEDGVNFVDVALLFDDAKTGAVVGLPSA